MNVKYGLEFVLPSFFTKYFNNDPIVLYKVNVDLCLHMKTYISNQRKFIKSQSNSVKQL